MELSQMSQSPIHFCYWSCFHCQMPSGASSDMLTTRPPSSGRHGNNRPYSHTGQVAAVTVSLFNSNRLSVPCRAVSGRRWWTIFGGICLLSMATRLYDLRNPAWVAYVYLHTAPLAGLENGRSVATMCVCVWGGGSSEARKRLP